MFNNADYSLLLFGDHDLRKGRKMIDFVAKNKPDLLIMLGDYAYDLQDDNG